MRIIRLTLMWEKLNQPEFTTFRFSIKDKDWYIGEQVQVYYKNRSPHRKRIGVAEIIQKVQKHASSDKEARENGFNDLRDMDNWMIKTYGEEKTCQPMNKLTLKWVD